MGCSVFLGKSACLALVNSLCIGGILKIVARRGRETCGTVARVLNDSEVSVDCIISHGYATLHWLSCSCSHRLFVWLYAPGEGVPLLDLDPSHDVGLCDYISHEQLVIPLNGRELSGLTLLWTSSLSMPAIAIDMGQTEARDVGYETERSRNRLRSLKLLFHCRTSPLS